MRKWLDFALTLPVQHCTLMYDGMRLDRTRVLMTEDVEAVTEEEKIKAFLQESTDHIKAQDLAFSVQITVKEHKTFLQCLQKGFPGVSVTAKDDSAWIPKLGDGIPWAIYHLMVFNKDLQEAVRAKIEDLPSDDKAARGRSFRECQSSLELEGFRPHLGIPDSFSHSFLLFSVHSGSPRCLPVLMSSLAVQIPCPSAGVTYSMSPHVFLDVVAKSTDRGFMASFLFIAEGTPEYPARFLEATRAACYDGLLDLRAF